MIFNSHSNYPIGLDISDLSLKVIQLNKIGNKIKIQALGNKDLPEGMIEHGEIKDKEGLTNYIKELLQSPDFGQITSNEVITCLPETRTFVKLIEIEKSLNPINTILETEMEKYIPIPTKEMYFDWQIIEENKISQNILIGASPQKLVDQYTEILNLSGLSPVALEIEPISICRSLLAEENPANVNGSDKNYCIFDLGAARSSILLYSKNTILFTLSIPISGDDITKQIAKSLKLDYKQAEKAKIICGLNAENAEGIIKNIIKLMADDIIIKIQDAILFYKEKFPNRGDISQILLSGGGADINGLQKYIEDNIKINTAIGNSLWHINIGPNEYKNVFSIEKNKNDQVEQAQDAYPNYATAMGLALRSIFTDNL